jgi:hypothetical protein
MIIAGLTRDERNIVRFMQKRSPHWADFGANGSGKSTQIDSTLQTWPHAGPDPCSPIEQPLRHLQVCADAGDSFPGGRRYFRSDWSSVYAERLANRFLDAAESSGLDVFQLAKKFAITLGQHR